MFLLNFILDSLFPTFCISCNQILLDNERDDHLCGKCLSAIIIKKNPEKSGGVLVYSPFDYDDVSAGFIKRLKYDCDRSAAAPMARFMTAHIRTSGLEESIPGAAIVPVPLHPRKLRARGFNQAELLAGRIGKELKIPVLAILKRTRMTTPQSLLESDAERMENIRGAFAIDSQSQIPEKVILVDDIRTSGATMNEAARILRSAGVRKIDYLVFARAK